MDPNANLKEQRELAEFILSHNITLTDDVDKADRLAELVLALDEWISKGGFLPAGWANAQQKG